MKDNFLFWLKSMSHEWGLSEKMCRKTQAGAIQMVTGVALESPTRFLKHSLPEVTTTEKPEP